MQVHEARQNVPTGYTATGPASSDTVLSLRVALVQNNIAGLIDALYDVSSPSSPNYGKWLSKTEVEAYVAPKQDSVAAVNSWLSAYGLNATALSPAGDWLGIELPVSKANNMLAANFSVFSSTVTGSTTVRTLSYSVPSDLVDHIDLIHPTIIFPDPNGAKRPVIRVADRTASKTFDDSSPCASVTESGSMTPACLQHLYGIPATPATVSSNGIAVTEYEEQYAQGADLHSFLQQFRPDVNPDTNYTVISIDGGENPQDPNDAGVEADLDLQYTAGLATGVPATVTIDGEDDFLTGLLNTGFSLLGLESPPQVVSTSWGGDENEFSPSYATNLCNVYAQLGARGVSMIFSSGDGGVSGNQFEDYCTIFNPTFPSTCPHITTVGATYLIPEVAADFSGGGFSNYFPRPDYQSEVVSAYLALLGNNDTGLYNASGRAYPDVSAYGVNCSVVIGGVTQVVSGTSCSAPIFASTIAILNDRLLAAGKPTLGFLNPWLYSGAGAAAFTDIVSGNNTSCGDDDNLGFFATKGWDPVTGFGTPKFASLLSAVGL
ncbi:predicted protein [Postia placenta Mad-698-R]|uniref:tripeptidyl-peptidase II n=1 Tax=Postia placenta MAD-698-R-SB12 TaxID=670580 RepID=A0A1X6N922_9APHY|nr:hypothetical protein POSPLADRAFT_1044436 [Postia placenta MAD-698-R-SB12]EED84182.1 predicted protein [Postia placenta Mad-698-R]OSX65012.1 hypothetical protein POSPLADRAFT_1044436 [Postia placenta MAD-698-R-SB12]